jgi:Cu+-exporting ATPase
VVIAGSVNVTSVMYVLAERVGNDTTLSQIVKLVSSAQASKAPIQATADKVSAIFVPIVIGLGCLTFMTWFGIIEMTGWIPTSFPPDSNHIFVCLTMCISVIVVACPCALGLATPTATMVGTGVGAKLGILIKGGGPLEMAHKITKIVFDKTGTLTFGKMSVYSYDCLPSCSIPRMDLLGMIGLVETNSEHPIGKSIVAFCPAPPYKDTILACESVPGSGMFATLKAAKTGKTHKLVIGNLDYITERGCNSSQELIKLERSHATQGRTVIFVAVDGYVAALISLADTIKPEAHAVVKCLKRMGIKVAMITGDQSLTANTIAQACGITEVHAGVSPAGKQELVAAMQLSDCVAMIGDGVNDSACLAQADMGIAVYGGTDVALAAASVVLMRPDLKDVVTAIDLSRTIMNRIWLNFFFATAYNIIMVPLAMGIGAPWGNIGLTLGITLPAMVTGFAMSMSSVSVVLSSLLLQFYTRPIISDNGELSRNQNQSFIKSSSDIYTETMHADIPEPQNGSLRQLISAASSLVRMGGQKQQYRQLEEQPSEEELHLL